ncbi:MAG: ATP-binding cassette domain-containing protein, partial [Chitinophagia bacterium]|nr:ATP-binding cassette domain-containing protein [Chitinophagia bacterium]
GAYADFEGSIQIDKVPIRNYNLKSLRATIGILLHQYDIFQGTLWENVTMGNPSVQVDKVITLFERVGLAPYFSTLKEGFETILDPTGQRLPRQIIHKILLVRALCCSPRLLLLEEPWSGMEEENRLQIMELLNELKECTIVVVSNDEDFAKTCNQVWRMSNEANLIPVTVKS